MSKIAIFGRNSQDGLAFVERYGAEHNIDAYSFDINDADTIKDIILDQYDYIINFAAFTKIGESNDRGAETIITNTAAVCNMLTIIRDFAPKTKFFSCGSIEQFRENNSIYGISKNAAQEIVKFFRQKYGLFAVHGILSHHFSGDTKGVVRKIVEWCKTARCSIDNRETIEPLTIGNLETKLTMISAARMCEGIWAALNAKKADDWVFGAHEKVSIRQILEFCMDYFELRAIPWQGDAEYYYSNCNDRLEPLVKVSSALFKQQNEIHLGSSIIRTKNGLGWVAEENWKDVLTDVIKGI